MSLKRWQREKLIAEIESLLSSSANEPESCSAIEYACEMLREFGRWSQQDRNIGSVSSSLSMFISSGGSPANISDDDALKVNAALAALMMSDPREACVLSYYYLVGLDDIRVAEEMRIGRNKARELRRSGEGFVASELRKSIAA